MPVHLLIDNWTLQNAGELLHGGLTGDTAHEIVFSADGQTFQYSDISKDTVSLECVCKLLHNLVFADELWIDSLYTSAWTDIPSLAFLAEERVLVPKPFTMIEEQWEARREAMADELCSCLQLRERHEQNKKDYAVNGRSGDEMLAQLLWGGAGLLARADFFRLPYVPHPLRARLFARARFLAGPTQASEHLRTFVDGERLKLYQRQDDGGFYSLFHLPPVMVEIVNEAGTLKELLPTALQLRRKYRQLRHWLSQFQAAIDAEDVREVMSRKKLLQSVSRNIDALALAAPAGDTTVQFGVSWLKVTMKGASPLNALQNRVGVRAQINRLVVAPPGRRSFRKLLKMLGEENSPRGIALEKDFLRRYGTATAHAS